MCSLNQKHTKLQQYSKDFKITTDHDRNVRFMSLFHNVKHAVKRTIIVAAHLFMEVLTYEAASIKHDMCRKFRPTLALCISFHLIEHNRTPKKTLKTP